jgi:ABC-type uncharacterized transport system YnjBCD permease subunit
MSLTTHNPNPSLIMYMAPAAVAAVLVEQFVLLPRFGRASLRLPWLVELAHGVAWMTGALFLWEKASK